MVLKSRMSIDDGRTVWVRAVGETVEALGVIFNGKASRGSVAPGKGGKWIFPLGTVVWEGICVV